MRARLLIVASAVAMLGWGTVLPYQYAYAASTRGWGSFAAAAASSLFSVGALLAAPLGGRLADRVSPVLVAVAAKVVAAAGAVGLGFADSPAAFLTGMFVFGLGITAAAPAQSVLVLRWVGGGDRRKVFAWQFTGQALGMAVGAFAAGYVVDLHSESGMWPAFAAAAAGFVVSAGLILLAGARRWGPAGAGTDLDVVDPSATVAGADLAAGDAVGTPGGEVRAPGVLQAWRLIWAVPALRWTALVTVTLALGFYAQFESGLPAYALTVLDVHETTIGLAAAVNCVVIIALQMVVVRLTARRSGPALLIAVGAIWTLSWLVLAGASLVAGSAPELAATLFVTTFGIFAVGETMYAPVLNPLTASLAPSGLVGTTLGLFTALQTGFSAVGPLVAGLLLGAGLGSVFVGAHVGISLLAVFGAWRLRAVLRSRRTVPAPAPEAALAA
ncbi:MFS transporter [Phycicoccus sp. 3266]|uniref:MFS transporter n=1 Tax=Phycicoccus sp. 3266 TaxID=2817751 RepID=UPI002858AE6E|nr:MFS transporter [Phycicoccus sp. 3266]MDR6861819.1 MFS family permease [Phycicoccus sp. 3266]